MSDHPNDRTRRSALALAVASVLTLSSGSLGRAESAVSTPSVIAFDEIDHVYTTEPVPPPGSFERDAGQVAVAVAPPPRAAEPQRHNGGIFGAMTAASTVLGNAGSIVGSSGELGRAIGIADAVVRVAPVTVALGMAGSRRFDALLQTYLLPRVSPTGAVMLAGFLSAQSDFNARYPSARARGAHDSPPAQLATYARGSLRHYTIAANGWVRIEEPGTKVYAIVKPEFGKTYVIDPDAKTIHETSSVRSAPASADASSAASAGNAAVAERIDALGRTTIGGVDAIGYRTHATMRVSDAGSACPDTTVSSTRVEYFGPYRIASDAANASPAAGGDGSGCRPTASVRRDGTTIPNDRLLVYAANTIETKRAAGDDRYTVVIERGNFQEYSSGAASVFDIPGDFHRVTGSLPARETRG